jgi:hypothetical protein
LKIALKSHELDTVEIFQNKWLRKLKYHHP